MTNRPWLNNSNFAFKRPNRGIAAIADALAVFALIVSACLVLSDFTNPKHHNSNLFRKIQAGTVKAGDHGQLTKAEMIDLGLKLF
jgi:hypothetical protein